MSCSSFFAAEAFAMVCSNICHCVRMYAGGNCMLGVEKKRKCASLFFGYAAERLYLEYSFFSPFPLALVCECCIISFHVKKV